MGANFTQELWVSNFVRHFLKVQLYNVNLIASTHLLVDTLKALYNFCEAETMLTFPSAKFRLQYT